MYICGLIPWNFSELAEAVPIGTLGYVFFLETAMAYLIAEFIDYNTQLGDYECCKWKGYKAKNKL